MPRLTFDTPFGPMTVEGEDALTRLWLPGTRPDLSGQGEETPPLLRARDELLEYFSGRRHTFDLPLAPAGTDFLRSVWAVLAKIPYGETRTYGQVAAAVGRPRALRAVGQANHVNPLPIFLPCHRVVGKDGALTGYAGGLELKRALLALESGKECFGC